MAIPGFIVGRTQLRLSTNLETADQNTLLGNATLIFLKPEILFCGDPQPFRSPGGFTFGTSPNKVITVAIWQHCACALFKCAIAQSLLYLALEPATRMPTYANNLPRLENKAVLPRLFYMVHLRRSNFGIVEILSNYGTSWKINFWNL